MSIQTTYRLHDVVDNVVHVYTDYRLDEVVDKRGTCPYRLHTGYTMSLINVAHVHTDYTQATRGR